METLENKTAVVTGAASGIGLAMVRRFARAGAKLVLSDIDDSKLDRALEEVIGLGATAVAVTTDVADEAQNHSLFETAIDEFGALMWCVLTRAYRDRSGDHGLYPKMTMNGLLVFCSVG